MQTAKYGIALALAIAATPLMAAQKPAAPVKVAAATPAYPVAQAVAVPAQPVAAPAQPAAVPVFPFVLPYAVPAQPGAGNLTAQQWLERMTDFTQNASAFKDPRTFTQWYGAMTDPSMAAASMNFAMEPGYWIRMMQSMMQPAAITNYMGFMDPRVSANWVGGMMDPGFYLQNAWSTMDPARLMRWMMLPLDPQFMQAGFNMMNPNTYMKWMMAPMDPRVWGLMFAPMNPQLYGSMAGALFNPAGMGTEWQTFMNPNRPVVSLMPPSPVNLPFNVLDPTTYGYFLNMLTGFLPAGTQQMFPGMVPGAAQAPAQPPAPVFQPGVATTLSLSGDTLFKSGKSSIKDLTAEGKVKLDDLAARIKNAGKIDTIRVVGHADKMGKASANMKLSQARAAAVANYLKAQGVKAGKVITAGKGDSQPVVTCDAKLPKEELKACLQPNRRVEIEVTVAK
jgi:outer membrane protein OmpA-like peptidoglycan-associated protein